MESLESVVGRIARRDPARAEATLQADVRSFILAAELNVSEGQLSNVDMEAQVGDGTRHRIDIETGTTVIEVKRDLSRGTTRTDAEEQLGGYLQRRTRQTGARYLGVLTDGQEWRLYVPDPKGIGIIPAGETLRITSASDTEKLRYWLGTVLATVENIRPTAEAIVRDLGSESPAYSADRATLSALYNSGAKSSEINLKRELWAKLLRTAFGSAFDDDKDLFVDHTLLVLTGEIIAHAVLGFDISPTGGLGAKDIVSGKWFHQAQISGVVESDFFDWPAEVEGGEQFVRSLAARLARFDWTEPDHDVLKHLYEAVIAQRTRESLGEYYTPDWLAEVMVSEVNPDPLNNKLADVACGSGTFIFHAVRAFLKAAESSAIPNGKSVEALTSKVMGVDIHPVAVTLARVTYLLAIGSERLAAADRGPLRVPIFLGDSIQWEERRDLLAQDGNITVSTEGEELVDGGGGTLFSDDLVFPRSVAVDAEAFDALVSDMAERALDTSGTLDRTLINPILDRAGVKDEQDRRVLVETFSRWRGLNRTGRDHIWGYYVRNLVRPIWLTQPENRVDILVGNPPWLRYSKMTGDMQRRYITMGREKNLLSGPSGASARDLSTLFVARALELYASPSARFSFVMPHGTLTRKPHEAFRSGRWNIGASVRFGESWDLGKASAATGFPMTSCVIHGGISVERNSRRMPANVDQWEISGGKPHMSWSEVQPRTNRTKAVLRVLDSLESSGNSPYKKKFRSGAIIYPRVLFFVDRVDAGPLGAGAGRTRVRSRRSMHKPWNEIEPFVGTVENEFIHPVHLGETTLPFRMNTPLEAVVPIGTKDPSSLAGASEIASFAGASEWSSKVESEWELRRSKSEKKPLRERVDYSRQLSAQLPLEHAQRVVYSKSGNTLAAARLEDPSAIVENKLYWATVNTVSEGRYLVGILNSGVLLERVRPLQSVGLFGPRDFDKHVFDVPFPAFDTNDEIHLELVRTVADAERIARDTDIAGVRTFQAARKLIRERLNGEGIAQKLEGVVEQILPVVD